MEKILIAGLDNAGKSSIQDILKYLSTDTVLRRIPSREIEIFYKNFLDKKYVFFIPPGQEELRIEEFHGSLRNEYFNNVSAFIFIVDCSDITRFKEVQEELKKSLFDLEELSPDCKTFLLFAHKQDLEDAVNSLIIKKEILDPLEPYFKNIIKEFKIFETTIINPETIHEPFIKAIAKHMGLNRINFDKLANWIRKQTKAKMTLITDSNGLLLGESFTGDEKTKIYAAYIVKIFSAMERFQEDYGIDGIKVVVLENDEGKNYSLISRTNKTTNDYLTLFIGNPSVNIGMTRIINKKGLEELLSIYENYKNF